jgi:hypothetical protein
MEENSHQDEKGNTHISGKKLVFLLAGLVMALSVGGGFVYYKSLQNAIQAAMSAFAEECTNLINNSRSSFTKYEQSSYEPKTQYVVIHPPTALNSLRISITSIKNLSEINSKYTGAVEALKTIDSLNLKLEAFQDIKSKKLKIEAIYPLRKEVETSFNEKMDECDLIGRASTMYEKIYGKASYKLALDVVNCFTELGKIITKNDISWNLYMGKNFNSNDRKLYQESNRQVQEEYENLNNICRNAKG